MEMKKQIMKTAISVFLMIAFFVPGVNGQTSGWKAGVAKVVITPEQSMWLAGYGSRNHPSEGTEIDLWAKALAFQDPKGKKAVMVSIDNVGSDKPTADHIRSRLKSKFGLSPDQVILNYSHTHSGPVLINFYTRVYPLDAEQLKKAKEYSEFFENQIVTVVGEALKALKPAQLYSGNGITRFAVNRRNNVERELTAFAHLNGPSDYSVPVLKVADESGNLIAVAFGYACHATTTGFYKWSGDYPGFAMLEVERSHPGALALFFQGAGADQNPLPRGTITLAKQYGRELAAAVEKVLELEMKPLAAHLTTTYSEIALPYTALPSKNELIKISDKTSDYPSWQKSWAEEMMKKLSAGEALPKSYPFYPCQVWKIGDQSIMTMGGELVVEYAIKLKEKFGNDIFVLGYTNNVMSYVPSVTILQEGGYEGIRSQLSTGLPGTYKPEIESIILNEMSRLAGIAGVTMPVKKENK
jgi:hypothetical protein